MDDIKFMETKITTLKNFTELNYNIIDLHNKRSKKMKTQQRTIILPSWFNIDGIWKPGFWSNLEENNVLQHKEKQERKEGSSMKRDNESRFYMSR